MTVPQRRFGRTGLTIPHITLGGGWVGGLLIHGTEDQRFAQLNEALEADGVKLSVNDLIIKALAKALHREPQCNVSFQGDVMHQYSRQDISVAVAAPSGLITPIIKDAGRKGLAEISTEMKNIIVEF